jgi:phosphatidate phosphatase APP1
MKRSKWFIRLLIFTCLFLWFFPWAPQTEAGQIKLRVTRPNETDLKLEWDGQTTAQFQVERSRYKDLSYPQTLFKTMQNVYQDPDILGTSELFFYSIDEIDCSKPTQSLVRGRVLCQDTLEPVVGCDVKLRVTGCPDKDPVDYTTSTDINGLYEVCIECPGCQVWVLKVEACCGPLQEVEITDCPPAISAPTIYCECTNPGPCPEPDQTLLRGRVICQDTLEPVAGCEVKLEVKCPNEPSTVYTTVTDVNGWYEICVKCPGCQIWTVIAKALCCDAIEDPKIEGCPATYDMPDLKCTNCGQQGPCGIGKTEITGRVVCGPEQKPVANCKLDVSVQCTGGNTPYTAYTDADGYYKICVECPNCTDWTVVVEPMCCSGRAEKSVDGCPPQVEMPLITCDGCPQNVPCDPGHTQVVGRVVCGPDQTPMIQCKVDVVVKCGAESQTYTAYTDANGYYEICVACPTCTEPTWSIVAEPWCCAGRAEKSVDGCPPQVEMPLIGCDICPQGMPCDPGQTEVVGRVVCGPNQTPVADCKVDVATKCNGDTHVYTAYTDADGYYKVCVTCPTCTDWTVVAEPWCCSGRAEKSVQDCPAQVEMPLIGCDGCPQNAPCEPGHTQVVGRVVCGPDQTPMVQCKVNISVQCGGVSQPYTAYTDGEGYYKICVECPQCTDPSWKVVAEPDCCSGRAEKIVDDCPPQVEMPVIGCDACPQSGPCEPGHTQVVGRVVCGLDQTPMADCEVDVIVKCGTETQTYTTFTDGDGYYKICVACPNCQTWSVIAEPSCCSGSAEQNVDGCPQQVEMPLIWCDSCPDNRPCGSEKSEIKGRVVCGPDQKPMAQCKVDVAIQCDGKSDTYTTYTDEEGYYKVCITCWQCTSPTWKVVAEPWCCAGRAEKIEDGCPPQVEMPLIWCDTCPIK